LITITLLDGGAACDFTGPGFNCAALAVSNDTTSNENRGPHRAPVEPALSEAEGRAMGWKIRRVNERIATSRPAILFLKSLAGADMNTPSFRNWQLAFGSRRGKNYRSAAKDAKERKGILLFFRCLLCVLCG
jgi:hypothetical protein